jgi:hypothetical protein
MITQHLFALVIRLIFSRLARNFTEHHGACESAFSAWVGPLHLEVNQCHVLDHEDVVIGTEIPIPLRQAQSLHRASRGGWAFGKLEFAFVACRGEERIREPGFQFHWWPQPVTNRNRPKQTPVLEEEFPF